MYAASIPHLHVDGDADGFYKVPPGALGAQRAHIAETRKQPLSRATSLRQLSMRRVVPGRTRGSCLVLLRLLARLCGPCALDLETRREVDGASQALRVV